MRHPVVMGVALSLAVLQCFSSSVVATQVDIKGAVSTPGQMRLPPHARLSDAALAAGVRPDAYMLGAAWLRPTLLAEQQRLKAGLLFDLDSLRRHALKQDRKELAELSASLGAWLQTLPAQGRQMALLDPRAVEVNPTANRLVADGDILYFPQRPATIHIVGAVDHACELPVTALQDAHTYLKACPRSRIADADWIFVVQPDGRVFEQGIGIWNRSHALALAPGAVIYVPLNDAGMRDVAPDLNRSVAAFLATQPLAEPEDPR